LHFSDLHLIGPRRRAYSFRPPRMFPHIFEAGLGAMLAPALALSNGHTAHLSPSRKNSRKSSVGRENFFPFSAFFSFLHHQKNRNSRKFACAACEAFDFSLGI
jgi:hypothetical protein